MPLTNVEQVESYFSNPENIHKLHIYEIVDFNNNIESVVSQNTNNFLKLKYIGVKLGIYEAQTFSPQLKMLGDSGDIGMKINTDLVFISNDDFSFLERTSKTYVFTIQEPYSSSNSDVYFITDGSIKAINELSEDDLEVIKLDDESNLVNLYSIGLQNIKKLEVGKNSTINFKLVDELPDFASGKNKITKITYKMPINSLVQAIQLVGEIKNSTVDTEGIFKDEQIDIEVDSNIGCIPLFVRYKNLNSKANIEILNFSLAKQLPLKIYKSVINNSDRTFEALFSEFKENGSLPPKIQELVNLIKKLILSTYVFSNDFDMFDKQKNNDFINYFNTTYAGHKAADYNNNLIYQYELKYPEMVDTIAYSYFKAICFSLSNVMISPYGYKTDGLSDEHKNILWFYIDCPISRDTVVKSFNNNGSFKDELPSIQINISSKYFLINFDEHSNITIVNKTTKFNEVKNGNYLPKTQINKLDDDWYQVWIFTNNQKDAYEILYQYYFTEFQWNEKTISIDNFDRYPTDEECRKLLPPDAKDIEIIYQKQEITDSNERLPVACPLPTEHHDGQPDRLITPTTTDGICRYEYYHREPGGPHGPSGGGGTGNSGWREYTKTVEIKYKQTYRTKITYRFKTKYNFIDEMVSYTSSQLMHFLLIKNSYKHTYVDVGFRLKQGLTQTNWFISNIKEDYTFGLFNSPSKMSISYLDQENQEQTFEYPINNSFQKIDNTNALTRNKY